jgi:aldose 1-epimerase
LLLNEKQTSNNSQNLFIEKNQTQKMRRKKNIPARLLIHTVFFIAILVSCSSPKEKKEPAAQIIDSVKSITIKPFGKMNDGQAVMLYTLKNKNGMEMSVINYGGIIVSLKAPDKNGKAEDVVLGFDSLSDYLKDDPFFGALIGRYGNRIAKGKFSLDGANYSLPVNNGLNHLHGGPNGFYNVFWNIETLSDSSNSSLKLTYKSKDGEEGYPGNMDVEVVYTLTENNELQIAYKAKTDKKTIVNLTQHSYFNLSGNVKRDILDHQLMMAVDKFLPVDKTLIPTGELKNVKNTPFDFTIPETIGARISDNDQQLKYGLGYDHCWVFSNQADSLKMVAALYEPVSGRYMEVFTTEPAIQFYSGNFLDGKLTGKMGVVYKHRSGLCLETQHFPDSPNKASFPSTVLNPGETYQTTTIYKFSVKK